jgi:hypothetical protein
MNGATAHAVGLRWETVGRRGAGFYPTYRLMDGSRFTGICFSHCGHPTALWPYAIIWEGQDALYIDCGGVGFRTVSRARQAAEALYAGTCTLRDEHSSKYGPVRLITMTAAPAAKENA